MWAVDAIGAEATAAARAELAARGWARVVPALRESAAVACMRALKAAAHVPLQRVDAVAGFQAWRFGWQPGDDCAPGEHPLCDLGRWLRTDGVGWASAVTGLALAPEAAMLVSERMAKGAFHDAFAADEDALGRVVACRIALVPQSWPAAWGGHLELVDRAADEPVARLAPTWNAIDLIDVRRHPRWRLSLLDHHVEGHVVTVGFTT